MRSLKHTIIIQLVLATTISSVLPQAYDSINIGEKEQHLEEGQESLKRIKKQVDLSNDKYTDAAYAGKFAFMLKNLESQNKEVYTNFISSGFAGEEIPRELPPQIRSLSRISSQPQLSASNNFLSSNSIQPSFPTGEKAERINALREAELLNSREIPSTQRQNLQLTSNPTSQFPTRQFSPRPFPPRQFPPRQFPQRQFPPRQNSLRQVPRRQVSLNQGQQRRPAFRRLRV